MEINPQVRQSIYACIKKFVEENSDIRVKLTSKETRGPSFAQPVSIDVVPANILNTLNGLQDIAFTGLPFQQINIFTGNEATPSAKINIESNGEFKLNYSGSDKRILSFCELLKIEQHKIQNPDAPSAAVPGSFRFERKRGLPDQQPPPKNTCPSEKYLRVGSNGLFDRSSTSSTSPEPDEKSENPGPKG